MHDHAHTLSDEELECLRGCSSYEQYKVMRIRFEREECGFCSIDQSLNTTLFENKHWIAWENAFRNGRHCTVMLVIITRQHWRKLSDITPEAWSMFPPVIAWAESVYSMPGGMLFMRFGDMRYNVGTVPHLHFNLWVPDRSDSVIVPIAKNPEMWARHNEQMLEFCRQFENGE